MPSIITAVLPYPYLTLWMASNNAYYSSVNYTVSGNVATVGTHPFSTGNKIYVANGNAQGIWFARYAIFVSDTQISVATTYDNAIAGIATPISGVSTSAIANVPVCAGGAVGINFIAEQFLGYSKSAQSFAVTDNIAIDFTIPAGWGGNEGQVNSTQNTPIKWAFGLISDTGGYALGLYDHYYLHLGDSVTGTTSLNTYFGGKTSLTTNCRILLQNRQAKIQIKTTSNTYLTMFTSSTLNTNIQGLRFFANLALNGLAFTNCTITYL